MKNMIVELDFGADCCHFMSAQRPARSGDHDSAVPAALVAVAGRRNNALASLGSDWAVFWEAQRPSAVTYPQPHAKRRRSRRARRFFRPNRPCAAARRRIHAGMRLARRRGDAGRKAACLCREWRIRAGRSAGTLPPSLGVALQSPV